MSTNNGRKDYKEKVGGGYEVDDKIRVDLEADSKVMVHQCGLSASAAKQGRALARQDRQ